MPKQNPYYIKDIKKLPETYTVSYFNESEWNKDLSVEEIDKNNELAELEYRDRSLYGSQYGPGNEQSKAVVKFASKAVISVGVAGAIIATGGAVTPLVISGIGTIAGGELVKAVAKHEDNEFFEWIGDTVSSTGINLVTGGLGSVGAVSTSRSLASNIARETVKNGREGYETFSLIKDTVELSVDYKHAKHRDEGISYKSDCYICNSK